jgi:hypothetical protein
VSTDRGQTSLEGELFPKKQGLGDDLPVTQHHLESFSKRIDLLKEVVAQLNKDFQLNGFEVDFTGNEQDAYRELSDQLIPLIDQMLEHQTERFWSLVYAIDLNETKVREALFGDDVNALARLTDLILKRELQKVVIRNHFAGRL